MRTSFRGIRQLEYFLTICEAGSFTRAAERLYVSQPAVTNAIRSLEEELGIQLFDRSQKLATLTAEGRIFAGHVEKIMHGITRTVEEIHSLRNLTSGVLDIGLTALGGQSAIISLLKAYRHAYPDIQMILHEDTTGNLQQALIEEKLDLAIFAPWQKNNSLSYEMLDEEELVVCCSRHHALHRRNSVALADLSSEKLILMPSRCFYRQRLVEAFEECSSLPQIVFESQSVSTICALVAANCGISILPESLVEEQHALAAIPLEPSMTLATQLVWKTNHHLSHAAEAFLQVMQEGEPNP